MPHYGGEIGDRNKNGQIQIRHYPQKFFILNFSCHPFLVCAANYEAALIQKSQNRHLHLPTLS